MIIAWKFFDKFRIKKEMKEWLEYKILNMHKKRIINITNMIGVLSNIE